MIDHVNDLVGQSGRWDYGWVLDDTEELLFYFVSAITVYGYVRKSLVFLL